MMTFIILYKGLFPTSTLPLFECIIYRKPTLGEERLGLVVRGVEYRLEQFIYQTRNTFYSNI